MFVKSDLINIIYNNIYIYNNYNLNNNLIFFALLEAVFLLMEYCSGGDLFSPVAQMKRFQSVKSVPTRCCSSSVANSVYNKRQ